METIINLNKKVSQSIGEKLTFFTGLLVAFLLPIFIIPNSLISFNLSKNILFLSFVTLLILVWAFYRIKKKQFSVSKNPLIVSACLIPFAYLLSALFSGTIKLSLLGSAFEIDTFLVMASLFILMLIVSNSFSAKNQVFSIYRALVLVSIPFVLVHLLRIFLGVDFLSLGILNSTTSNLLGSWNDLGIFFGVILLLTALFSDYLARTKITKISAIVMSVFSFIFVALINSSLLWIALAMTSLMALIYMLLTEKRENKINYSKLYKKSTAYVFIGALLFAVLQTQIGSYLPNLAGTPNYEASPNMSSTLAIGKSTLGQDPLLGVGSGNFSKQWMQYKPQGVNESQFWNTDFNFGSGLILTSLTTLGLLGFLLWLTFIVTLLFNIFKLLKRDKQNNSDRFINISVSALTLFLSIFLVFYVSGITILALSFLIFGIFIAQLKKESLVKVKNVFVGNSKVKTLSLALVVVIFVLADISALYFTTQKVRASVSFNQAVITLNSGEQFAAGYESLIKAANTYPTDFYLRTLTDVNLMQLQQIFAQEDVSEEDLQAQFQEAFGATVGSAQRAVQLGTTNYLNWFNLAKVYGAVVPVQVEEAYETATQAYMQALTLNPTNPMLVLSLANLEIANGDMEKAKEYIGASIQMKNNYSDAYYLLSQLEMEADNREEAVKIIEALASVSPNDPQVFLQLGSLRYEDQNYEEAQAFLERSVTLSPYYSDAKYLLALTYNAAGEKEKAVGQFQDLKILNPEDTNIDAILTNLQEGRDPFYGFEQSQQQPQAIVPQETKELEELEITEDGTEIEVSDEEVEVLEE